MKPSKPTLWGVYFFQGGGSLCTVSNVLQLSITVSLDLEVSL